MICHLLTATVLVAAFAFPVAAEDAPALAEHLERIGRLPAELVKAKKTDREIVDSLFLATLVRLPTDKEKDTSIAHFAGAKHREEATRDLAWALVNTNDFLKLHGMDKDIAASLRLLNTLTEKWGKDKKKQ